MVDSYSNNFILQYIIERQNLLILQIVVFTLIFFTVYKLADRILKIKTEKFEDFYSNEARFLITDECKTNQLRKDKMNKRLNFLMNQRRAEYHYSSDDCDVSSVCVTNISYEKDKLSSPDVRPSHSHN